MLAADLAILTGLFLYKVASHDPQIEYAHLLMTYHFGFAKRALMGSLISLTTASVPISTVCPVIGFVAVFRYYCPFGFSTARVLYKIKQLRVASERFI
jgi:hypothetical protein